MHLSESSENEVANKLQRIRAIDALLPTDDGRKENLARQVERLENLDEMYRDIERLEVLLRGAAGSSGEPGGSAKLLSDAENVLNLLRGFRTAIEGDDHAGMLEKKGQSIVAGDRIVGSRARALTLDGDEEELAPSCPACWIGAYSGTCCWRSDRVSYMTRALTEDHTL